MKTKSDYFRRLGLLTCIAVLLAVSGCGTMSTKMNALLVASSDVNADASGKPFPVVVRIYELKSKDSFESADFFAIYDNESGTLGGDLLEREEYELTPDEQILIRRDLNKDTHYIGVLAAYRDIQNAQWLKSVEVRSLRSNRISIQIGKNTISIVPRR